MLCDHTHTLRGLQMRRWVASPTPSSQHFSKSQYLTWNLRISGLWGCCDLLSSRVDSDRLCNASETPTGLQRDSQSDLTLGFQRLTSPKTFHRTYNSTERSAEDSNDILKRTRRTVHTQIYNLQTSTHRGSAEPWPELHYTPIRLHTWKKGSRCFVKF